MIALDYGPVERTQMRMLQDIWTFTQTVTSTTTGEKITLQQRTTCQTSNVIYLIECSKSIISI